VSILGLLKQRPYIKFHRAHRPERWEAIPEAAKAIPGVFSNLLTFAAGTHACIGYRFSIIE
jgi:cytochrome P450